MTSIILQQILTISKPLNHGITLFSKQELPFSQLEYKLHSNSEPGNKTALSTHSIVTTHS